MSKYSHPTLIIAFAIILFIVPSCSPLKEPVMKGIEKLEMNKIDAAQRSISFNVLFHNPNKIGLKLKSVHGNAWVDGNPLGLFSVDSLIKIPRNADFRIPIKLELDMKHFLENMSTAFLGKQVLLKVRGTARIGKGWIFKNYPIDIERKQSLNEILK